MADINDYRGMFEGLVGNEVMVWTAGGHYFRGILEEINDRGFMVIRDASCTLAGERHERDIVYVDIEAVDAIS